MNVDFSIESMNKPIKNNNNILNQNSGFTNKKNSNEKFHSIQDIRKNISNFNKLSQSSQKDILREFMFPLVLGFCQYEELAPLITDIMIDITVLDVFDILSMLENEIKLAQKVKEVQTLIKKY